MTQLTYPILISSLFIISLGNSPRSFAGVYKAIIITFGVIGCVMISMMIIRVMSFVSFTHLFYTTTPLTLYENSIKESMLNSKNDTMHLILTSMVSQISEIVIQNARLEMAYKQYQGWTYLVAIISTIGIFFIASIMNGDVSHMFTCFLQCTNRNWTNNKN